MSEKSETKITEEGYLDMLEKVKKQYQRYVEISKLYELLIRNMEEGLRPDPIPSLKYPLTANTYFWNYKGE